MDNKLSVGIVGCRNFKDYELFKNKVQQWELDNGNIDRIISGGATGADALAERYAKEFQKEPVIYKPKWKYYDEKLGKLVYDRTAGLTRNTLIVNDSDKLIAFPSDASKGTWDSVKKAKDAGKDVTIYKI